MLNIEDNSWIGVAESSYHFVTAVAYLNLKYTNPAILECEHSAECYIKHILQGRVCFQKYCGIRGCMKYIVGIGLTDVFNVEVISELADITDCASYPGRDFKCCDNGDLRRCIELLNIIRDDALKFDGEIFPMSVKSKVRL